MGIRTAAMTAVCCLTVGAGTVAQAEERLYGEQIRALISGKTTYGKHAFKDNEGYVYRKDDGTFVAFRTARNELRRGTWSVRNDMFCRQPEGEDNRCREVYDQGDGTYRLYVQPKNLTKPRKHVWTINKIADGNPENLK